MEKILINGIFKIIILNELCIFYMWQIENDEKILIVDLNLLMLLDANQNLSHQKKNVNTK